MKQNIEYSPGSSALSQPTGSEGVALEPTDGILSANDAMYATRHGAGGVFSDPHVRHDLGLSAQLGSEVLVVPHERDEDARTVMSRVVQNVPSFLATGYRDPDEVLLEERLAYEREELEEQRQIAERRARAQAPLAQVLKHELQPASSQSSSSAEQPAA